MKTMTLYNQWKEFNQRIDDFCEEFVKKMDTSADVTSDFDWSIEEYKFDGKNFIECVIANYWTRTPGSCRSCDGQVIFPLRYVDMPDWYDIECQRIENKRMITAKKAREEKMIQNAKDKADRKALYEKLKDEFS